mmetsp:Transcript_90135/g.173452  ORF Transcript_90135/g.173452 Transcript_90135/m.173452 type:complete len:204 (-) Transcript_90135:989-1600(-)
MKSCLQSGLQDLSRILSGSGRQSLHKPHTNPNCWGPCDKNQLCHHCLAKYKVWRTPGFCKGLYLHTHMRRRQPKGQFPRRDVTAETYFKRQSPRQDVILATAFTRQFPRCDVPLRTRFQRKYPRCDAIRGAPFKRLKCRRSFPSSCTLHICHVRLQRLVGWTHMRSSQLTAARWHALGLTLGLTVTQSGRLASAGLHKVCQAL